MNEKHIRNDVDYIELLYDSPDISIYELDALYLGLNANDCYISEECIKESLPSFADKPLYGVIDNQINPLDGSNNDFMEHFREEYPWRITRDRILPFGCVPESSLKDARLVERDGHTYLRINVVVWKKLLPHVSEILQRREGTVRVSVEFNITDGEQDESTGIIYINKLHITAITVLGAKFQEIMEGSGLKTVKFSYSNYVNDENKKYFSYFNSNLISVPDDIRTAMSDGVAMRQKYKRGGPKSLFDTMSSACSTGYMSRENIDSAYKYFSGLSEIPESTKPVTSKYIVYKMYGGELGRQWVESVCNSNSVTIYKNSKGGSSEVNIQIDNERDSAVNSASWDNPGKSLYGPILDATNKKSLVDEAYLVVEEGWEDAPSEHLKYPHHVIRNEKLVLDVAGVKAAYARAKQMGIFEGKVKAHLERHYRELGLSMNDEKLNALQEQYDKLSKEHEAKCAEFDAKCAEFDKKCADFDASEEARKAAEKKCAELQIAHDEKCAKIAEYEKKETTAKNMALIDEYVCCLDTEKCAELRNKACDMSYDDMYNAIAECVMSFAKQDKLRGQDGIEDRRMMSYGFPAVNHFFNSSQPTESPLSSITKKSGTKVM